MRVDQQHHGYQNGHQLLASSIKLEKCDQDLINRISDLSGPLSPGQLFAPYLTGYPLPSGRYVLARTWHDDEARRAGCVRTHSLIVDGDTFSAMEAPSRLTSLLAHFEASNNASLPPLFGTGAERPLKPLHASQLAPLVEALFLEQPRPIVAFGLGQGEAACLRLVEALWPSWRRRFAFCSFTLQARTLVDRPFDFLVAPKSARSRFSDWPGRKLDLSPDRPSDARHAWSAELSAAIFSSARPRLAVGDDLGVLSSAEAGPNALRLSMLWRDLQDKFERDPSAVLGLLDIVATAGLPEAVQRDRAEELTLVAAPRLAAGSDPKGSLRVLELLTGKLPRRRLSTQTLAVISTSAERLAKRAPDAAVEIVDAQSEASAAANAVARGVGAGLAHGSVADLAGLLIDSSNDALLRFLTHSPQFRRRAMSEDSRGWTGRLASALVSADERTQAWLRRQLLPLVALSSHAVLLEPLLSGAEDVAIRRALRTLVRNFGAIDDPAILSAFAHATLPRHTTAVRDSVLSLSGHTDTLDELLQRTLSPTVRDLGWLVSDPRLPVSRRAKLILAFVQTCTDSQLRIIARDGPAELAAAARALISVDIKHGGPALVRIAPLVHWLPDEAQALAREAVRRLPESLAAALLLEWLPVLWETWPTDELDNLFALSQSPAARRAFAQVGRGRLLGLVTPQNAPGARLAALIRGSLQLPAGHPIRGELLANVERVVGKLAGRRPPSGVDVVLLDAWAELVMAAAEHSVHEPALSAAAITLNYAFDHPKHPTGSLMVVAFPLVHTAAQRPQTMMDLMAPFLPFDLDRAKAIRERFADCAVRSAWKPSDVVMACWAADALDKMFRIFERTRKGHDLLKAGILELREQGNVSAATIREIESALSRAAK